MIKTSDKYKEKINNKILKNKIGDKVMSIDIEKFVTNKTDITINDEQLMKNKSKLIKTRANIEFRISCDIPNRYEAYLYKVSLYDKDEFLGFYIGYHTGKLVFGKYYHSSESKKEKCVKFRKLCRDASIRMVYDIIDIGSTTRMTVEESELLIKADPKNNDKCFNDNLGSAKYTRTDNNKVFALRDKILNGSDYDIKSIDAETLYNEYKKVQARTEENKKLSLLQEKVDGVFGRLTELQLWTPVLLVEVEKGIWKLIDGNTRVKAVTFSKHGKDLPAIHVPYEDITDWTSAELHSLANGMNVKSDDLSEEMSDKDAIKEIVRFCIKDNMDIDDPSHEERLEKYKFSPKQIESILNRAKIKVKSENSVGMDKTWITWTDKGWKDVAQKLIDYLESKGFVVLDIMSTGRYNMEKVIDTEADNRGKDIIVPMHNPEEDVRLEFDKVEKEKAKKLNDLFNPHKSSVKHIQLPTSRDEELTSPSDFWESIEGKLWLGKNNLGVI